MAVFYTSSKEKRHTHIVYLCQSPSDDGYYGRTSTVNGHYHNVIKTEENTFILSGEKNHTHDIEQPLELSASEIAYKYPKDSSKIDGAEDVMSDDDVLKDFSLRFARDREEEDRADFLENGFESESLFFGADEVWNIEGLSTIKKNRRAQNKSSLSFNILRGLLNTLISHVTSASKTPTIYPREQDDERLVSFVGEIVKEFWDENNGDMLREHVARDALISGRGVYWMPSPHVSYRDNKKKFDLKIKKPEWDTICFGPYTEQDLSDCDSVSMYRWVSEDNLRMYTVDGKDPPDNTSASGFSSSIYSPLPSQLSQYVHDYQNKQVAHVVMQKFVVAKRKYIRNKDHHIVYNGQDGALDTSRLSKKKFDEITTIQGYGLDVIEDTTRELWEARFIGNVLIEHRRVLGDEFSFVPVVPERRKVGSQTDNFYKINNLGMQLKDPAITLNLVQSETKSLIHKGILPNDIVGRNIIDDPTDANIKEITNALSSGMNHIVVDDPSAINRLPGASISPQVFSYSRDLMEMIKEIASIPPELMGAGGNNSSILDRQKTQKALAVHNYILSALRQAEIKVAEILLNHIKHYLTDSEEAYKILKGRNYRMRVEGGDNVLYNQATQQEYSIDEFRVIWGRLRDASFSVAFGSENSSKTEQFDQYESLSEIIKQLGPDPAMIQLMLESNPTINYKTKQQVLSLMLSREQAEIERTKQQQLESQQAMIAQQSIAADAKKEAQQMAAQVKMAVAQQDNETKLLIEKMRSDIASLQSLLKTQETRLDKTPKT